MLCYFCKKQSSDHVDKPGFKAECEFCRSDLHVCKNCHFYDEKVYNECRESNADRIVDKTKANYCEYFQLKIPSDPSAPVALDPAAEAKRKLEALFKK